MNKKIIFTENAPKPIGPYSQAVLAGNTLYISGTLGISPKTGQMVSDSIESETKQVLENISQVLQAADMNFENIVKATIFLKDLNNFKVVNDLYAKCFESNPPARETIEISKLPANGNVEISMIAVK